jgi:hypothetical protein
MSILRSQNSRIKNTVKEIKEGDLKKSRVEVTEVYQEERKKVINNGGIGSGSGDNMNMGNMGTGGNRGNMGNIGNTGNNVGGNGQTASISAVR